MQNIQRTAYGVYLQTCLLTNQPVDILANSSMNQKLGINPSVGILSTDRPSLAYFAIGNGGHTITPGSGNLPATFAYVPHRSTDASLYSQLPFILRAQNNDLTSTEMLKYRLRKVVTYNGATYIAYYLKVIDYSSVVPSINYNAVSGSVTTTTPFVPNTKNLNPIPPVLNNQGVVTTTGDYLTASATLPLVLSANDITEILNACTIIYGSPNYAIISEIAMCTGIDKTLTGTFGTTQAPYMEAIGVQVMSFLNSAYPLTNISNSLTIDFELGSTEPLLLSN